MVRTCYSTDGSCVAYAVAEITKVPYYELIHRIPEKACEMSQNFFTQLLLGMIRSSDLENTSFEIIFHSIPVTDQTYAAQVRMYFVIRKLGSSAEMLTDYIDNLSISIKNDMERQNYSVEFLETEEDYEIFFGSLRTVDCSNCAAVSKKDRVINSMFGGMIYFNDAIIPTENVNVTAITNTMTQYPDSLVSLQIIPTRYEDTEKAAIMQVNSMLEYYIGELRRLHGMMPLDAGTQALSDAFHYYLSAFNNNNAYYNFLVFSPPNSIDTLCNKLISVIENETARTSNSLEMVDIRESSVSICDYFEVSPWVNSNYLIYNEREHSFWDRPDAPTNMMRLRYIMTLGEIRTVFKFPIDDGTAIGLDSKKILTNREKLNKNIISEGNFKIGIIQNSSANSIRPTHAGIPLNDFTKHGLIVGTPGSGKTNFSLGFLLQMWNGFNIPFIAIEPTKTEYRSLIDGISDLQIFTPGKSNVSPYIINPFVPPTGVTVETYVPSLMTAFKAAFSMPDPLPDIFLASINECYNEYGWRLNSTKDDDGIEPFGMYEFIRVFKRRIQSMDYKGDVKANMESAGVVRLVSLIEQNSFIYDNIHTIPIEDLLCKPTVIELNAINNKEQKSLIMALLLILICIYTKNNVAGDGKLKNILLIDEAHVLLGGAGGHSQDGSPDSQSATIEAVEDMIAEIRSYGTGIIIADQAPTKVGKNIVANTNVKVMFRLVEKDNKDMIRNATNMTDADYDRLGRLGVGEAMLHYGRVHEPLHIKTYNVLDKANIRPFIFDEDIAAVSHYWDDKQYLLIPHNECKYNCECTDHCDFKVKADADFLSSRLVNRFRPSIKSLSELASLLPKLDIYIKEYVKEMVNTKLTLKLSNCTKIKFLRKMLLAKSIEISKTNYRRILEHKNFLKKAIHE